jgi:hypothetical protein
VCSGWARTILALPLSSDSRPVQGREFVVRLDMGDGPGLRGSCLSTDAALSTLLSASVDTVQQVRVGGGGCGTQYVLCCVVLHCVLIGR